MSEHSLARKLIRAWLKSPDVKRIPHDDDGLTNEHGRLSARMRPTSDLAKASAEVLQGFGFVMPVGDGSYLVTWPEYQTPTPADR